MNIQFWLDGKNMQADMGPDTILLDPVREPGRYSVRRGCKTVNCGLCTVWLDGKPVLSCSTLAVRVDGCRMTTLEGSQEETGGFDMFLIVEDGEQYGFCSSGFIVNVLAIEKELDHPDEGGARGYLSGNLCCCNGYMSRPRAVKQYLDRENGVGGDI